MTKQPSITEAVESGCRRDQLAALSIIVAEAVGNAAPRDLAALSRRLMEITKEIEMIDELDREAAADETPIPDEPWNGLDL